LIWFYDFGRYKVDIFYDKIGKYFWLSAFSSPSKLIANGSKLTANKNGSFAVLRWALIICFFVFYFKQ
jgi:hypothetical protein